MDRILQLGTGRFLRGFVDVFTDDLERARDPGAAPRLRVTAVETTGSGMAERLTTAAGYPVWVRGLTSVRVVDDHRVITVIDRAIDASDGSAGLVAAALDPEVRLVVSNVTEAGYAPGSLPRRLADALAARARAGMPGVVILPCELVERNGDRLRALVQDVLEARSEDQMVVEHVRDANTWGVTLVDRIASRPAAGAPGGDDPLAVVVEPFASWVVELPADAAWLLRDHPAVTVTDDVTPFALRKIRILNGAHTALVARCRGTSITFVREAMADPEIAGWLEALLREEIVPALGDRIADGDAFVTDVLERFRNPFLDHRLADIAVGQAGKVQLRLLPTYREHVARYGRVPPLLAAVLAGEGVSA
ncbi:MAG: altronate dehydrogenase [Chloroflexota bacterium]